MKVRCEYCYSYIDESEEKCPCCGAPNSNYKRVANQVPTTIEELKGWYLGHNLPPYEITRFFIGENYQKPKAFGIYKDVNTGKFIVYKNKDTGERVIRYEGNDEKYAVNELYLKLKEEVLNQKRINQNKNSSSSSSSVLSYVVGIAIVAVMFIVVISIIISPKRGYYNINDTDYYYVNGKWFVYDKNDWTSSGKPDYSGNLNDYYEGSSHNSTSHPDISDSSVYDDDWDSNDWDSDSDWDSSDSWDSGGTDWGSDW